MIWPLTAISLFSHHCCHHQSDRMTILGVQCSAVCLDLCWGEMQYSVLLVFLLLHLQPPVSSLFLSLGSGDSYGTICGVYDKVVYLPELRTFYEKVCENNCQTVIENCVNKMNQICSIVHQKQLDDSFCTENYPDTYCRTRLKLGSCFSCVEIPRRETALVPRTIKKVRQ